MEMEHENEPEANDNEYDISEDQWDLPVGIDEDGNQITLRQVRNQPVLYTILSDTASPRIRELTKDQKKKLALRRLEGVEHYGAFRIPGFDGAITKEVAIKLIKENHPASEYIIKLELDTIQMLIKTI